MAMITGCMGYPFLKNFPDHIGVFRGTIGQTGSARLASSALLRPALCEPPVMQAVSLPGRAFARSSCLLHPVRRLCFRLPSKLIWGQGYCPAGGVAYANPAGGAP